MLGFHLVKFGISARVYRGVRSSCQHRGSVWWFNDGPLNQWSNKDNADESQPGG